MDRLTGTDNPSELPAANALAPDSRLLGRQMIDLSGSQWGSSSLRQCEPTKFPRLNNNQIDNCQPQLNNRNINNYQEIIAPLLVPHYANQWRRL